MFRWLAVNSTTPGLMTEHLFQLRAGARGAKHTRPTWLPIPIKPVFHRLPKSGLYSHVTYVIRQFQTAMTQGNAPPDAPPSPNLNATVSFFPGYWE